MKKIDLLAWSEGISFTAYGLRMGVRVNVPSALDELSSKFPPGWKCSDNPVVDRLYSFILGGANQKTGRRSFHIAYGNSARLARTMDLDEAVQAFESDMKVYVSEAARRRVFVHAGVVGWKGTAIIIPGRSFSGKSTMVAELVRAGATYYSDEFAVLDAKGRVHPYARPLSIRIDDRGNRQRWKAEELGGTSGSKPMEVGAVLSCKYKPGASWRPASLSQGAGLLELMANTVAIRYKPQFVLGVLKQTMGNARCFRGVRGEAQDMVEPLFQRLAGNKMGALPNAK